jgi:hypothetical protein
MFSIFPGFPSISEVASFASCAASFRCDDMAPLGGSVHFAITRRRLAVLRH